MLSLAITRRTLTRSGKGALEEGLRGDPQPVFEPDARLPAEQLARPCHVRVRVADVAGARRMQLPLDGKAEDRADRVRELVDAGRAAGGDVDDRPADLLRLRGEQVGLDHVRDEGEVSLLLAVAVDRQSVV